MGENGGEKPISNELGMIYILLFVGALIAVIAFSMIVFLILPLCLAIIGFFIVKSKRFWWGLLSFLSFIYLWVDLKKEWLTHLIVYGDQKSDSLLLENGLFSGKLQEYVNYIYIVDVVGIIIGILLIYQSYSYNKEK